MILYYSATGNSEYVAKQIAQKTDDKCVNLFEKIKSKDFSEINSEKPFVFVSPTYAWQVPHFFSDWLLNATFTGCKKAYFVMTCGADAGGAGKHNRKICEKNSLEYMGTAEIVLPDSYIYASKMVTKEEALEQVEKSRPSLEKIIETISQGEKFEKKLSALDSLKSGIVNKGFSATSKFIVKSFYADEKCVGCGKCEKLCVMNNIRIENGRPVWSNNCSQCYACIHRCPKSAVQIKGNTEKKLRYVFPDLE